MAEAIRRDCDPVLFALGFRNPRHSDWDRWHATRRNVYIRWRGGDYDEIVLVWARYGGAWFTLEFQTSKVVDRSDDGLSREVTYGLAYAWRGLVRPLCIDKFGPWRSISSVVGVVSRTVAEVDAFFRLGEGRFPLVLSWPRLKTPESDRIDPVYRTWGDPTLDPERDERPD